MTTIRFRLGFIFVVSFVLTGLCLMQARQSYLTYSATAEHVEESFELVEKIYKSKDEKFTQDFHEYLKKLRAEFTEKSRQDSLSDFIQSYANSNRGQINKWAKYIEKNEASYRRSVIPQLNFERTNCLFYSLLALGVMASAFALTFFYALRSIFRPLKDLNRKMIDFLNHKYTYKFAVPSHNEIGSLQGTFNSLAQQVLANMDELKELDKAKSEFLSIASHELRTPLTSIKGSLNLMNQGVVGKINDAATSLLKIAETETDRLIRLINDLLDLAKIEARKFPLKKQWTSLNEIIDQTLASMKGFGQPTGVQLISEVVDVNVYVDKDRIQQVLTNLLSNAIKYSPSNGQVSVICRTDEHQHLYVDVVDQGPGIAPEDQEIIFQKFRQATSQQNPLVKGTGLGLAIAKALVEEHGGEIGIRSAPQRGSTFYFTLVQWQSKEVTDTFNELRQAS